MVGIRRIIPPNLSSFELSMSISLNKRLNCSQTSPPSPCSFKTIFSRIISLQNLLSAFLSRIVSTASLSRTERPNTVVGTTQHSAAQYNTVQCRTAQHRTEKLRVSTVQYRTKDRIIKIKLKPNAKDQTFKKYCVLKGQSEE